MDGITLVGLVIDKPKCFDMSDIRYVLENRAVNGHVILKVQIEPETLHDRIAIPHPDHSAACLLRYDYMNYRKGELPIRKQQSKACLAEEARCKARNLQYERFFNVNAILAGRVRFAEWTTYNFKLFSTVMVTFSLAEVFPLVTDNIRELPPWQ